MLPLILMGQLLPLLLLLPFVALDDACITVGGPTVNQVPIVVTTITMFIIIVLVIIIMAVVIVSMIIIIIVVILK